MRAANEVIKVEVMARGLAVIYINMPIVISIAIMAILKYLIRLPRQAAAPPYGALRGCLGRTQPCAGGGAVLLP